MTLAEALEAPRVYVNFDGTMDVETSPVIGWTRVQIDEMEALGLQTRAVERHGAFSRVHAIAYDAASQTWYGAADPDWEGSARGPRRR